MISRKNQVLLKIVSVVTIVFIMITGLQVLNQHSVIAAEKQTVYFGNFYQEEVTNEDYISRLHEVDFVDGVATVGGIDFACKNKRYYYSTPIEWEILEDRDNSYLLISKKILDSRTYTSSIGWPDSGIRKWCKDTFYNQAFTAEEQNDLIEETLENECLCHNPIYTYESIITKDYVWLLNETDVTNGAYGFSSAPEASDTRVAYHTQYADGEELAGNWYLRGNPYWYYYNTYVGKYVFDTGEIHVQRGVLDGSAGGNYPQGIRPVIRVKRDSKYLYTQKPDVKYDFSLTDYDAEKAAIDALPDLTDLGSDTISGPEVEVSNKKFNLWKSECKLSIDIKNIATAKYDPENETVELIIGLGQLTAKEIKSPDPNEDDYDSKWKDTYQDIKSLVEFCGHKTNRDTWNKFQKTREKLKEFDADAVYKVKGKAAGYMKIQMDGTEVADILEGGLVLNFEAGASVKNPLFGVVYSEFGISGSVEGKIYVESPDLYAYKGSVGLTLEPSVAVGADVLVADAKGGLKGNINGEVKFPWKSFKENVNVSLTGAFFLDIETPIPGLSTLIAGSNNSASWDWNWPTVELYPDFGMVSMEAVNLKYSAIEPASEEEIAERLKAEQAITADASSAVYENAKPNMVLMDDGNYLVTYLDEVEAGDGYQAKLVYRIGNGLTWSEPIVVNPNTVYDTAAKLVKCGGRYYFIYTGGKSAVNEEQGIEEIAGSLDLYVSTLENGNITESQIIAESGKFKYGYDLVVHNDTVTAVWAENDANDIMLEEGGTVIYTSTLSDAKWGDAAELFSVPDAIESVSAGVFDNKVSVAYIYDDFLFVNGNKRTTGLPGNFDGAKIFDGKVYLRSAGELCSYDGRESSYTNVSCAVNYQVHGSNVYWVQQQNFKSEIYSQKIGTDVLIPITNDSSYIGSFCITDHDLDSSIVYTSQLVDDAADADPYGVTLLKFKDTLSRYQAKVTNIAYDILDYTPDKPNDFTFDITNCGTEELHNISLVVNCGDANVYSGLAMEKLGAGESKPVKVSLQIPEGATEIGAYVTSDEMLEDRESKYLTLEKAGGNISLEETEDGNLKVANTSSDKISNITLNIKKGQYGEVIRSVAIDSLPAGGSKTIAVGEKDWQVAPEIENMDDYYLLYCEVNYDGTEVKLDDNSICLRAKMKKAVPISKTQVSSIPLQVYNGKAKIPSVTIKYQGKTLVKDKDYTVSYQNNKKIGTAKVMITGKGGFTGSRSVSFKISVKKNSVYTLGQYKYKIMDARTNGKGTVALIGIKDTDVKKKLRKITVGASVAVGGKKFLVTEIGKNAFTGCTKAVSASIGSNVTKIGTKAFYGCKKLKTLTIKSKKLKLAGKDALKNIHAKATVKVPKSKLKAYKKLLKSKGQKKSVKITS